MKKIINAPPWRPFDKPAIIPIGHTGDNNFTRVIFPIEEPITDGTSIRLCVQPEGCDLYEPADTGTESEHTYRWTITAADTKKANRGKLEIWMQRGKERWVAYVGRYSVKSSLDDYREET